ncbi:MAG TPA: cellulase family glycosylhydrolase [Nevskiaceae bacterium]|nr:cellulase family glycosylhydrolase [Nevskiaceae bacterium]
MKKITAACLVAGLLGATAASAVEPPDQLRREGRYMVDSKNRIVLLHGVNAVWKMAPYAPPDTPEGFTAADAAWLKRNGFNSVRVGTIFAGVMPQKGAIDREYLRKVDRVVQLLAAQDIYVMLDFHQDLYAEKFGGEGFPDWAVHDDGLPNFPDLGFPANYFLPAVSHTFDNLWKNVDNLWDDYRHAWKAVARKWKDQDRLMGYDLINEPWPGIDYALCANPFGCPGQDYRELQLFQSHVMKGIREVDPANIVWFEPNVLLNSGAQTHLGRREPIGDPQIGLSWHKYCAPAALIHAYGFENIPGCNLLHQIVSNNAEAAIARMQATTIISEFGASDDIADLEQVTRQADANFTSWQYWHYKEWHDPTTESQESGGQGLFTDDGDLTTVKAEKLAMLSRTYPQATAGVPVELSFDPETAEFHYRYVPRAADGPTEIFVPVSVHYPDGYAVEVTARAWCRNPAPASSSCATRRRRPR